MKPGRIDLGVGEIGKEERKRGGKVGRKKGKREGGREEAPGCVQEIPGLDGWGGWEREEGRRRGWRLTCVHDRTGKRKRGTSSLLLGFLLDLW